ncbi:MAG TPA: aminotransferase class IV [Solirubrobacteraceae bacterium]|jgi:branched-subunit amino acid aminotransferase/4-amino-4-deoxychorismate lyase
MPLACLDGTVLDVAEARVPVTDEGLLRGDGVFEVMRLYGGRPFALDDHLARMEHSAQRLRLEVDVAAVRRDVEALLEANDDGDARLRVVVTRGGRRVLMIEEQKPNPPSVALACVEYAPPRILDQVKSLSYAANMLATRIAKERGCDEALLVTPHGRVLEAPTSSLFYVLDAELFTPPLDDHILDSITRRHVIELTGARERVTPRDDVRRMTEAFLASTTREVQPVHAIDDHELERGGPVTREAARLLRERIAEATGT